MPFGAEFSQAEINKHLKKHSGGRLNGWLNEHDFNVDTGVVSFAHHQAQRGAAGHSSHGAHVLDIVAGMDPSKPGKSEKNFLDRVRVIAINAPDSAVFKAAGTHLDAYMFFAIQRIADIADKVWTQNNSNFEEKNKSGKPTIKGYPIVINMSFGKHAGSKDALDEFPAKLAEFVAQREASGWSKVRFVMPAGNDNLSRCNAILEPKKGAVEKLNWRLLPEDQSTNYVEVWGNEADQIPINISLKPPQSKAQFLGRPNPDLKHQYRDLYENGVLVARVYLSRSALPPEKAFSPDEKPGPRQEKFRYLLCIAPTYGATSTHPTAPSGMWEIAVENTSKARLQCVLSVQTDQALSPSDGVNLRSYFDDPDYELFGADGALLDSYSFPPSLNNEVENQDIRAKTPVRRHGTMNASTTHEVVARVGGYRVSDRRPAAYSATGRGRRKGEDDGARVHSKKSNGRKNAPTASFPTEDGPAHFGILAAGAANGSVAAMSGTSFASAQGARELIKQLLENDSNRTASAMLYFKADSEEKASQHPVQFSNVQINVLGGGRIKRPDTQKTPRF